MIGCVHRIGIDLTGGKKLKSGSGGQRSDIILMHIARCAAWVLGLRRWQAMFDNAQNTAWLQGRKCILEKFVLIILSHPIMDISERQNRIDAARFCQRARLRRKAGIGEYAECVRVTGIILLEIRNKRLNT